MDALHRVIKRIHADPTHPTSRIFRSLVTALDAGEGFDLHELYDLNYSDFATAMELLKQWRLDTFRYERGWATTAASDPHAAFSNEPMWMQTAEARGRLRD